MEEKRFTAEELTAAFDEGFERGAAHGNLDWRYPPAPLAWVISESRKLIHGEPSEEVLAPFFEWEQKTYQQRTGK